MTYLMFEANDVKAVLNGLKLDPIHRQGHDIWARTCVLAYIPAIEKNIMSIYLNHDFKHVHV